MGLLSASQEAFALGETQSIYDAFEGSSFETVLSGVTGLRNLVHDRASREKLDIMLILEQFLWNLVQNT